eukprot:gene10387-7385_t
MSPLQLLCLVFVAVVALAAAQFEDEMGYELLQQLSGTCRVEMEGAIASSSQDISDPCKVEIQRALQTLSPQDFGAPPTAHAPDEGGDNEQDPFASGNAPRRPPRTRSEGDLSPYAAIAAFVAVLVAAAAGFVLYRNSTASGEGAGRAPAKKLSKKKEEKLRQRGQSRF